jgi:hypothetical protein
MPALGHFESNSEAASLPVYRSGPPAWADVLHLAFVPNNAFGRNHSMWMAEINSFGAPEEFLTNLTLRIEYRLGERDFNLFCASENLMTIAESCSTSAVHDGEPCLPPMGRL